MYYIAKTPKSLHPFRRNHPSPSIRSEEISSISILLRDRRLHESTLKHVSKHLIEAGRIADVADVAVALVTHHVLKVEGPFVRVVQVRHAASPLVWFRSGSGSGREEEAAGARCFRLLSWAKHFIDVEAQDLGRGGAGIVDGVGQEGVDDGSSDDGSRSRCNGRRSSCKQGLLLSRVAGNDVGSVLRNVTHVGAEVDDIVLVHGGVLDVVVEGSNIRNRGLQQANDLSIQVILNLPAHHLEVQAWVDDAELGTDNGQELVDGSERLADQVADG
jgi:hypothetical protein